MKKITLTTILLGIAAMAYAGLGPEIQFKEGAIDFGTVSGGELVNCTFIFTNTGDETLSIKSVQPSCGCTSAGDWTKAVEPGKTCLLYTSGLRQTQSTRAMKPCYDAW